MVAIVKLESSQPSEYKAKWKIVRTDYVNSGNVEGEIVAADEATGEFSVCVGGETKTQCLGPGGIRIVGRR